MGFFTHLATAFTGMVLAVSGFFFGQHNIAIQASIASSTLAVSIASTTQQQAPMQGNQATLDGLTTTTSIASKLHQVSVSQSIGTKTSTVREPVQPQVSTPATPPNSMLCNGSYYTTCANGNNLVCPIDGGAAYCEASTPVDEPSQEQTQSSTTAQEEQAALEVGEAQEELQSTYTQLSNISNSISSVYNLYFNVAGSEGYTIASVLTFGQAVATLQQDYTDAQNLQASLATFPVGLPDSYIQATQNAVNAAQCSYNFGKTLMTDVGNGESPNNAEGYVSECASYRAQLAYFLEITTP